ncbi:MAG: hypothetical protein ACD_18C00342G0003 [uncultured bacterium]|nr:MAG: hypothetical protein ACD_18C00342G0003 [uncultured bacterium]
MDKEKVKTPAEQPKEIKETLEKKDDTKQDVDVPEYVGPKFYGTTHPRQENGDVTNNASLYDLVEKNIKWSQVIYNQNKKIKRRLTMMVIGSYLRLFLILAPIILGVLYWPEILAKFNEYFGSYLQASGFDLSSFLGGNSTSTSQIDAAQIQKFLQSR